MQIRQGHFEIEQHDTTVCDHPLAGKRCEAPDQVGPPLSYMEEHLVFKAAESVNNTMGLCQFYRTSPEKLNVLTGPKSADSADKIYRMIDIAKRMGRQLTIIIFDGESVSPMCLLGELHSRVALSRMAIHMAREFKMGIRNHVYCCPICSYIVKNAMAFLDHIMVGHYWGSFSCGRCLSFAAANAEEMTRHIRNCGQSHTDHRKAHSARRKKHRGTKSSHKSKKAQKRTKEGVGAVARQKPHDSPTSKEQAKK